jgi:hypothetical protein
MEAIEFACVFEEITNKLGTKLDSDLVAKIFEMYEGSYENYTLVELLHLLRNHNIDNVPWNKKALIKMIEDKNLPIPKKKEKMEPTKWEHYRVRKSLDVIDAKYLEFYDGSIIQEPSGQIYLLQFIDRDLDENEEEIIIMCFQNMETKEQLIMDAEDFMWSLDNEDVTILQDRNYQKFMNDEQKEYWTGHIRYI